MSKILIEKNIMVPMRDGVKLATDIYRLEGVRLVGDKRTFGN